MGPKWPGIGKPGEKIEDPEEEHSWRAISMYIQYQCYVNYKLTIHENCGMRISDCGLRISDFGFGFAKLVLPGSDYFFS